MPKPTVARCRSCHQTIAWAITEKAGRLIPLDANPDGSWQQVTDGPMVTTGLTRQHRGRTIAEVRSVAGQLQLGQSDDRPRYNPHHRTCPNADEWQTRRQR